MARVLVLLVLLVLVVAINGCEFTPGVEYRCAPCGGDYICTGPSTCLQNSMPGCSLPADATYWTCCEAPCSVVSTIICNYTEPEPDNIWAGNVALIFNNQNCELLSPGLYTNPQFSHTCSNHSVLIATTDLQALNNQSANKILYDASNMVVYTGILTASGYQIFTSYNASESSPLMLPPVDDLLDWTLSSCESVVIYLAPNGTSNSIYYIPIQGSTVAESYTIPNFYPVVIATDVANCYYYASDSQGNIVGFNGTSTVGLVYSLPDDPQFLYCTLVNDLFANNSLIIMGIQCGYALSIAQLSIISGKNSIISTFTNPGQVFTSFHVKGVSWPDNLVYW